MCSTTPGSSQSTMSKLSMRPLGAVAQPPVSSSVAMRRRRDADMAMDSEGNAQAKHEGAAVVVAAANVGVETEECRQRMGLDRRHPAQGQACGRVATIRLGQLDRNGRAA